MQLHNVLTRSLAGSPKPAFRCPKRPGPKIPGAEFPARTTRVT